MTYNSTDEDINGGEEAARCNFPENEMSKAFNDVAKVRRGRMVAVLVSHGYGAGWYSWNTSIPACLFDPDIVALVEAGSTAGVEELASTKWPDGYWGGADGLRVHWVEEGTAFQIDEYDGNESLKTSQDDWVIA